MTANEDFEARSEETISICLFKYFFSFLTSAQDERKQTPDFNMCFVVAFFFFPPNGSKLKVSKLFAVVVGFCLLVFKIQVINGVTIYPIVTTWCCIHRERVQLFGKVRRGGGGGGERPNFRR